MVEVHVQFFEENKNHFDGFLLINAPLVSTISSPITPPPHTTLPSRSASGAGIGDILSTGGGGTGAHALGAVR